MTYNVYVIKSLSRNYIYVGISNNVTRRLDEHNLGKNKTTRPYRPFRLLHEEKTQNRISARHREKWFKSGEGKEFLKTHYI